MVVVEETISRWFTRIEDRLRAGGSAQMPVDEVIRASVSVIENYLTSVCLIATHKAVLPAKALLRSVGEFTAKLRYCIAGGTKEEVDERIQRWRKSSWEDYKSYWEAVRNACKGSDCTHIDERIRQAENELAQMTRLRKFSQTKQVLDAVFPQDLAVRVGVYAQHLSATHIDLVTLAQTVAEEAGTTEYMGDLVAGESGIELDLLSLAYLYVETVSKHYGWDYAETLSEYKVLTHSSDAKAINY
jgi:hypothetical protein